MTFDELLRNRQRLFWALDIGGWAGYTIAVWFGALAHEKPDTYFAVILVTAIAGFAATIPMRSLYHRLWNRPPSSLPSGRS